MISFRTDWFDLLAAQGTSPAPQFESINSLVLSLLYGLTLTSIHDYWENIAFTTWTFIGKVISVLFNMLSRFVIGFFPKEQMSFNFMAVVTVYSDLEFKKMKSVTISIFSPSI